MGASKPNIPAGAKSPTVVERKSDCELVVTRTFHGPARLVFEAWTMPELFKQWWTPKSCGLTMLSCEMDVRTGGGYRLVFAFGNDVSKPMEVFGKYIEVTPPSRIVWTNDEGEDAGPVTTVTFEERDGTTLLVMHDLYPSKAALDVAIASGSTSGAPETFDQLEELLAALARDRKGAPWSQFLS